MYMKLILQYRRTEDTMVLEHATMGPPNLFTYFFVGTPILEPRRIPRTPELFKISNPALNISLDSQWTVDSPPCHILRWELYRQILSALKIPENVAPPNQRPKSKVQKKDTARIISSTRLGWLGEHETDHEGIINLTAQTFLRNWGYPLRG